jgi:hypothetical protein
VGTEGGKTARPLVAAKTNPTKPVAKKTIKVNGASIAGGSDLITGGDDRTFTQGGKTFQVESNSTRLGGRTTQIKEIDPKTGKPKINATATQFRKNAIWDKTQKETPTPQDPAIAKAPAPKSQNTVAQQSSTEPSTSQNTQQRPGDGIDQIVKSANHKDRVEQTGNTYTMVATVNSAKTLDIKPNMTFKPTGDGRNIVVTWGDGHHSVIPNKPDYTEQSLITDAYLQRHPEDRDGSLASQVQKRIYGKPSTDVDMSNFRDPEVQTALKATNTVAILGGTVLNDEGQPDGDHAFSLIPKGDHWMVYNSNATNNQDGTPILGAPNTRKRVTTLTQAQLEHVLQQGAFITYTQVSK